MKKVQIQVTVDESAAAGIDRYCRMLEERIPGIRISRPVGARMLIKEALTTRESGKEDEYGDIDE